MSTTPLKIDTLEDGIRPRDWRPRKSNYKIPLRLLRLCLLGMFLPAMLVAGPLYLRYRVYSDQLYPLAVSDQRLVDARVSTTWCQSQIIRVNTTFNAYLMNNEPAVEKEAKPISMTRHLIMEDDMKEYWGFYLLRGSSVTVSTCVRWPGASLTIIRGHKNLHECAFIGDDSSEELEELLEVAEEKGLLDKRTEAEQRPSNVPEKMKKGGQNVHFHHEGNAFRQNTSEQLSGHHSNSNELDPQAMRKILTQLFVKTQDTKKKQKENPHHHYEAVFRDAVNIDKPPVTNYVDSLKNLLYEEPTGKFDNKETSKHNITSTPPTPNISIEKSSLAVKQHNEEERNATSDVRIETGTQPEVVKEQEEPKADRANSAEVFQDVLRKINSLGGRGKQMLRKLMDEIDAINDAEGVALKRLVNETMNDKTLSERDKRRRRRDLVLSSPLHRELTEDDEDADAAIVEEGMLHPDGIAEDRGTVNETSLNDRSNSEFWSSFSSSEERLLECKGLILNLPLTPHRHCTPKHENDHSAASFANTVTYRVPLNGYYFFVFNSENEIQPNYVRVKFDLLKTVYDTSNPVHTCKNSTKECSLPFSIFSNEKTILELPVSGNDSQWNEEYIVMSTCEPRTAIYIICVIMVPVLILCFAFN